MIKKLTYSDIFTIIDTCIEAKKDVIFYLNGGDVAMVGMYLEGELGISEAEDFYYEGVIDEYKIYTIGINTYDGKTEYVLEEAYLNGTLLYQETLDDEDIYIDNNLKFRDDDVETRIVGNKIFFDMIDGSDKYTIR